MRRQRGFGLLSQAGCVLFFVLLSGCEVKWSDSRPVSRPADSGDRAGEPIAAPRDEIPEDDPRAAGGKSSAAMDGAQASASTGASPTSADERPLVEPSREPASAPPRAGSRGSGDAVVEIVFEDIQLPIQQDMVFRPFMLTDRVRDLDGRRVRIHGYMLPDSKTKGITQFVLLKNTECKFGPGGQADHLINVLMVEGVSAKYRDDPISVQGVLKVNPFQGPDGNTWSIYDLACEQIETYRPRR